MALYWIVHDRKGERQVFIQEAGGLVTARLKASVAGHDGTFLEAHMLDANTAKKIPKAMIGRSLTAKEAKALLKRIAG